ncbi:cyclic-AMP phosphodiesterase [Pyrrhoderma noxium]|uniref:Cyclic-AMP phosphodiesterase n=1 Tax=Pyrrhoderma noxium TaxID=2282107 RepID=A0A286UXL8_9AGAM|nr:cyclic-AMP phosphodiesterase [Pyrrhoderma noxium]
MSLVLLAGSFSGSRKSIWPNLASWNPEDADYLHLYDPTLPIGESPSKKKKGPTQDESENEENSTYYTPLRGPLTVCMFPISHGPSYDSSAFFIHHTSLGREFLFFGDVEYDLSSINPRISNVWSAAAPKFVSAVFIECSWPSGRPDDKMFGHLTPEHLIAELQVLANFVSEHRNLSNNYPASTNPRVTSISPRRRSSSSASPERKRLKQSVDEDPSEGGRRPVLQNALSGLRVYIVHCKEELTRPDNTKPINQVISNQVRELVNKLELGVEIVAAEQGSLIHIVSIGASL